MRIVIATGIYPPEVGGAATVALRLAEKLVQLGNEVIVVTYGDRSGNRLENNVALKVVSVSRLGGVIWRYARYFFVLLREVQKNDTLVFTDALSTGLAARLVAYLRREIHLIARLGGERLWEDAVQSGKTQSTLREYWSGSASGASHRCTRLYYRWLFTPVNRIIVPSGLLLDILVKIDPRVASKVQIVPNRASSIKSESKPDNADTTILRLAFIGRMYRVKNIAFLARVIRRCFENGRPLHMTFAGDGDQVVEATAILEEYSAHVAFLGDVTPDRVKKVLQMTDVLLLPSLSDVYPNAAIEALASGVPVLITAEHGLEEGFGGLIPISPKDELAWVDVIERMLNNETYEYFRKSIRIPSYTGPTLEEMVIGIPKPPPSAE